MFYKATESFYKADGETLVVNVVGWGQCESLEEAKKQYANWVRVEEVDKNEIDRLYAKKKEQNWEW